MRLLWAAVLACATLTAAPVVVNQRTLWEVRTGASPQTRATEVASSILLIANDYRRDIEDLREVQLQNESILLIGRVHIFSVTDEDAKLESKSRAQLFAEHRQITLETIRWVRDEQRWSQILKHSALAAGAWILAFGAFFLIHNIYERLLRWLKVAVAWKSRRKGLSAWYDIFEGPLDILLSLSVRLAFAVLGLSVFFTTLSYSLGQFPATYGVAGQIVTTASRVTHQLVNAVLDYIPNLLVVIIVGLATYAAIRIARRIADALDTGTIQLNGFHPEWARPTYELLRVLLILFGLVVAFPYLPGGESQALKGASIFIGVLVSLGSGSAMGNIVSGVILTYMRPFRLGDYVQIGETVGDVTEKSLLVTRIRTIKNVEIILPNSSVLGAHILNYSAHSDGAGLILNTTVTIGYDVPWQSVHELLIRASRRTQRILTTPEPFVLQTSLNDYHVSYQINAYTREANLMVDTYSELHKHIHEEFNLAGVEIMSPNYLAIRDGNTMTLPASDRPANYEPPSFRMNPPKHGA